MRYIEADGIRLAHIDTYGGTKMEAACGMNPFPWDWHQPVKRTKKVCVGCLRAVRR